MAKGKRKVISLKKRLLVVSGFFVFFILLGVGFSVLSSNLSFNGDVNLSAPLEPTLYNVFVKNARKGIYVREYTGEHQDSMNPSLSNKKIYHWYANNDNEANQIIEMNNVVFAGLCWQMVRTTDTGGVKLIYNGSAGNGKCLGNATNGDSYNYDNRTVSTNYYYGTEYGYDYENNKFFLSGNITTGVINAGTYTCEKTTPDGTCEIIDYLYKKIQDDYYYVFRISKSNRAVIGYMPFNDVDNSLGDSAYMYSEDRYPFQTKYLSEGASFSTTVFLMSSYSVRYWYYYSREIGLDGTSYSLINPISSSNMGDDKTGYYSFGSSGTSGTTVYYLVGLSSGNYYYAVSLNYPDQIIDYNVLIGNSITDNGDDTYTLNNTSSVSLDDWFINYNNYVGMYTCGDATTITCSHPRYIHEANKTYYKYIDSSEKILIAKERNGLQLSNTKTIRYDDFIINKANYLDYKYTCGTTSSICAEDNLRIINNIGSSGYSYYPNSYFSSSVTWDGEKYTLVDAIDFEHYDDSLQHYSCLNPGLKKCSQVVYYYGEYNTVNSHPLYYITLSNGEMIDDAINNMTSKSNKNSVVKDAVELWYSHNLISFDQYIEDAIYCQKRSIYQYGGFKQGNSLISLLKFDDSNLNGDLNCPRDADKLSVSNPLAQLSYKVGLLTTQEAILNNNAIINDNSNSSFSTFFLLSPEEYYNTPQMGSYATVSFVHMGHVNQGGTTPVTTKEYVRPVISLIPGIRYTSGDGSKDNPYVVDTN